jgi:hypothetical protein
MDLDIPIIATMQNQNHPYSHAICFSRFGRADIQSEPTGICHAQNENGQYLSLVRKQRLSLTAMVTTSGYSAVLLIIRRGPDSDGHVWLQEQLCTLLAKGFLHSIGVVSVLGTARCQILWQIFH